MQGLWDYLNQTFMPHGGCYFWRPDLLWLQVGSDFLIAIAYFSIPWALIHFIRRRQDIAFDRLFFMFASFIFFCGVTHVFSIITTWNPLYYTEGAIKAITGVVSAWTAVALWVLMPTFMRIPSMAQLRESNERLSREVSERERAEDELRRTNERLEALVERRTEELEQFAYAASHDLEEPLRHVRTYTSFLEHDLGENLPEKAQEDMYFIRSSASRMSAMIKALLDLSRAGKQQLEWGRIRVQDVIDEAVEQLRESFEGREVEICGKVSHEIDADLSLLGALYQNLISNALKYSQDPVRLEFSENDRGSTVIFGVRDNGIGIGQAYVEEIFKPFSRLHGEVDCPGSGIGLSLCRKIVERHGGEIWVESKVGEGSHFRFQMPKQKGSKEAKDAGARA